MSAPPRLHRVKMTRTMPYPGFPTDVQAPLSAMLTVADGTSVIIENIFESRYKHAAELLRFGAKISVEGRMEVIEGVPRLLGTQVVAPDLRGGFALILAGLAAHGETVVCGVEHIDRGYEKPEQILRSLGADIQRIQDDEEEGFGKHKENEYGTGPNTQANSATARGISETNTAAPGDTAGGQAHGEDD